MSEYVPSYRVNFISSAIERVPIGTRGLFAERAGNVVSVCQRSAEQVEVLLVLSTEEAGDLGRFLQTAKSPLARAFGSD